MSRCCGCTMPAGVLFFKRKPMHEPVIEWKEKSIDIGTNDEGSSYVLEEQFIDGVRTDTTRNKHITSWWYTRDFCQLTSKELDRAVAIVYSKGGMYNGSKLEHADYTQYGITKGKVRIVHQPSHTDYPIHFDINPENCALETSNFKPSDNVGSDITNQFIYLRSVDNSDTKNYGTKCKPIQEDITWKWHYVCADHPQMWKFIWSCEGHQNFNLPEDNIGIRWVSVEFKYVNGHITDIWRAAKCATPISKHDMIVNGYTSNYRDFAVITTANGNNAGLRCFAKEGGTTGIYDFDTEIKELCADDPRILEALKTNFAGKTLLGQIAYKSIQQHVMYDAKRNIVSKTYVFSEKVDFPAYEDVDSYALFLTSGIHEVDKLNKDNFSNIGTKCKGAHNNTDTGGDSHSYGSNYIVSSDGSTHYNGDSGYSHDTFTSNDGSYTGTSASEAQQASAEHDEND